MRQITAAVVQAPGLKISRDQQLNMKVKGEEKETKPGRGRGRGRGRGGRSGGRGRGKANMEEDTEKPTNEDTKKPQNSSSKGKKSKHRVYTEEEWEEWYENHWHEGWGEDWDHETWGNPQKVWDAYAWHDGKESLHKISKPKTQPAQVESTETGASAKSSKLSKKRGPTQAAEPESTGKSLDNAEVHPPNKKEKKAKAGDAKNAEEKTDGNKRKAAASKEKSQGSKKQKPAEPAVDRDPVPTTDKEVCKALKNYGKKFFGLCLMEEQEVKDQIKGSLHKFTHVRCNHYWNRPASGVHIKAFSRDYGYFVFTLDDQREQELEWPVLWAVTAKAGDMLVSCLKQSYRIECTMLRSVL